MNTSKSDMQARDHKVLAAIGKYFTKRTVIVNGVTHTGKTLLGVFQRALDTADALDAARASAHSALKEQQHAQGEADAMYDALKATIAVAAGQDSTEYREFGFPARRTAKKSAQAKAQAVIKQRETRAARHTMGPEQKAHIHGEASNGAIVASNGASSLMLK